MWLKREPNLGRFKVSINKLEETRQIHSSDAGLKSLIFLLFLFFYSGTLANTFHPISETSLGKDLLMLIPVSWRPT